MKQRYKTAYIWAIIVTAVFAGVSERAVGTFSTIWDYLVTDLDSSVNGSITKSEIRLTGSWGAHSYDIQYRYKIGGVYYIGNRVNYEITSYKPVEMIKKYPIDNNVVVYFDSSKPKYSSLEKTALGNRVYIQLFVLTGSFLFILFIFKAMG